MHTRKRLEFETVPLASSANTIEKLQPMFARHGLPHLVVSDNRSDITCK